jgi:hypothetical protein
MNLFAKVIFGLCLFLLTWQLPVSAQLKCKEETSKENKLNKCFHQNGEVSSLISWDKENKWGKLLIYKSNGTLINEWELRKIHGIARAEVEYHPNGQVSKVNYSSAPDAGIQRFESTYYYSPEGHLIKTEKDDYPPKLNDFLLTEEAPIQPNTVQCAEIWISKIQLTNNSKRTQKLVITPLLPNSLTKPRSIALKPKQTLTLDSCIQAQFFQDPINQINISFQKSNKKPNLKFKEAKQPSKSEKIFIYEFN